MNCSYVCWRASGIPSKVPVHSQDTGFQSKSLILLSLRECLVALCIKNFSFYILDWISQRLICSTPLCFCFKFISIFRIFWPASTHRIVRVIFNKKNVFRCIKYINLILTSFHFILCMLNAFLFTGKCMLSKFIILYLIKYFL